MRDTLFGLGLVTFVLFGSALDSQGVGLWLALAGVLVGMSLMVIASE